MSRKVVARNRRARFDYEILDTFEAGMVLLGSEVKSLRAGQASISEAYVAMRSNEAWLESMTIPGPAAFGFLSATRLAHSRISSANEAI